MKFTPARLILSFALIAIASFSASLYGQELIRTKISNQIPKNVPIDVEIIEPENAEDYPEKIRIRIRNVSEKPIYSLRIRLYLITDTPLMSPKGEPTFPSIELNTGSGGRPNKEDPTIKPSEYYTFVIPKGEASSFRSSKRSGTFQQPLYYRVAFSDLSFGNGTGFTRGGAPYSYN